MTKFRLIYFSIVFSERQRPKSEMDRWLTIMVFVLFAKHRVSQFVHILFYFLSKILHRKTEVWESAHEAWHLMRNQWAHMSLVISSFGLTPWISFLFQLIFFLDYVVFNFLDVFKLRFNTIHLSLQTVFLPLLSFNFSLKLHQLFLKAIILDG